MLKLARLGSLLLASVATSVLWAQSPLPVVHYDTEDLHWGPNPFIDCSQFDGMNFWIWTENTQREVGEVWPGPSEDPFEAYVLMPWQRAFESSVKDLRLWVPRDSNCHAPPFDGCNPEKLLRGMELNLLPSSGSKVWEVWGDYAYVDDGEWVGWYPDFISRSGVFLSLKTVDKKLNIHYEGAWLKGINDSAPGIVPPKSAPDWGTEWYSPGFTTPFLDQAGTPVFANEDDAHAVCEAILHGDDDFDWED